MSDLLANVTEIGLVAEALDQVATAAAEASATCAQTIEAAGAAWGQDMPGQAFATAYLPGAKLGMIAVVGSGPVLEDIADKVRMTAKSIQNTEDLNESETTNIPTGPSPSPTGGR